MSLSRLVQRTLFLRYNNKATRQIIGQKIIFDRCISSSKINFIKNPKLEDPSITDHTPHLPVGNPGEIDNIPPGIKKTGNSILFPWLYGTQPARIEKNNYFLSPIFKKLPIFPIRFYLAFARWFSKFLLKSYAKEAHYFDQEFLMGAQLSFERLCQSISSFDKTSLKNMMGVELYDLYSKELENIYKEGGKIQLNVLNVYNTSINDVFTTIGPKEGYGINNDKYFNLFVFTFRLCIKNSLLFNQKNNRDMILKELKKGTKFNIIVECDAQVHYQNYDQQSIIINDQTRRKYLLAFESDTFSFDKVSQVSPVDWNWKLIDVDKLIESNNLNNFLKWFDSHNDYKKIKAKLNEDSDE